MSASMAPLLSAARRRDARALGRAARGAAARTLARAWPRLPPEARTAAFRALPPARAAELFELLPAADRWLAYLGEVSEGAAPLLEGGRSALPRPGSRARRALRAALRARLREPA